MGLFTKRIRRNPPGCDRAIASAIRRALPVAVLFVSAAMVQPAAAQTAGGFGGSAGYVNPGSSSPGFAGPAPGTGFGGSGNVSNGGFSGQASPPSMPSAAEISSALGKVDPSTLNALASQMGLSQDEVNALRNQLAAGQLSNDQIAQICARLASKHIGDAEIGAIGASLGLSPDLVQQVKNCAAMGSAAGQQPASASAATVLPNAPAGAGVVSRIEQGFRQLASNQPPQPPSPEELSQFGYSLFDSPVSTFAPVNNVPVGNDYVIGPGDGLNVLMWGRFAKVENLSVERDGSILISEVGPLQVGGLTFSQAKRLIESRLAQITGVQVDVTMGQLRTIEVFVIGEVKQPGAYQVSALSHVSNALVAAGGITKVGSLRRIELRRGQGTSRVIDLYDMLMRGSRAGDERLEAEDTIFVPVIGPVVGVAGDVKRPAIYELQSQGASLRQVLNLAGGIGAFGYSRRIQVERVENHQQRVVLDEDLEKLNSAGTPVRDGDLVKVYQVLPSQLNAVVLSGNVNRPGKYQWRQGMRVSDLIADGEGLANRTFFKYALLRRHEGKERNVHSMPVNLAAALSGNSGPLDIALQPNDEFTVFSEDEMHDVPTVRISGEVRMPGEYTLTAGMRVSDLIYMAGGLTESAYQRKGQLGRVSVVNGARTVHSYLEVNLRKALANAEGQNVPLQPSDEILVSRAPDWHLPWSAITKGRVLRPGPYLISRGERLHSVLLRCGGLLPDAYLPGIVFMRKSVKELEQQRLDEARSNLQKEAARLALMPPTIGQQQAGTNQMLALATIQKVLADSENQQAAGRVVVHVKSLGELAASRDDIVLEDGDEIDIPKRPATVNVLGDVYNPNAIVWVPRLRVRDYLYKAGGPSEGADLDHIYVIRADGSVESDESVKNSGQGRLFPLLPVVSDNGTLMGQHLQPGDTIYVPEQLLYINQVQVWKDITQIISQSAMSLGIIGILGAGL